MTVRRRLGEVPDAGAGLRAAPCIIFADFDLSLMTAMGRVNARMELAPVEVRLQREKPKCADEYDSFFGCAMRFGATEDSFRLSAVDADAPSSTSNR